jgi:hypothetical protein
VEQLFYSCLEAMDIFRKHPGNFFKLSGGFRKTTRSSYAALEFLFAAPTRFLKSNYTTGKDLFKNKNW